MTSLLHRPRRLRRLPQLRSLLQETTLEPSQLMAPLFVKEGLSSKKPISSLPGQFQMSVRETVKEAKELWKRGVRSVILFGIPAKKDLRAGGAYQKDGIVQRVLGAIRQACPKMVVVTDVCLCEYMSHGHCGVVGKRGEILNDPSLELLSKTAVSHARAGADMVAPSDMMDGRVKAIRTRLDSSGFSDLPIMSYAVKYASSFYGPFRDAAESAPQFGDRRSYQMDFHNSREALREAMLDEKEGADILMVKPALPYLDILSVLRSAVHLPLAAYQVSGEYAMIVAAAQKGWIDRKQVVLESLTAIRRAGAQIIVTYFAKEAAGYLKS